ncbi:MAG: flagellar basal body rod C-terminal domain-containing protein [Pseudomonadota bacterium]
MLIITIDLSEAAANNPIGPGINNAADQLIAEINTQIGLAGLAPDQAAVSLNSYGQLLFESRGNITIDGSGFAPPAVNSEPMGTTALNALGITEGTFVTEDPSFTVQVGNDPGVTITIEPGDTIVDLEAKLTYDPVAQTGVPGLSVEIDAGGNLILRPGVDESNRGLGTDESFGGNLTIVGGPFTTDTATLATIPDNINIVSAIFGSFNAGPPVTENSAVIDVPFNYEVTAGSGEFINFRNEFLGPNAGIDTGIFSATNLLDYAQKIVDETSQDYIQTQSAFENEDTLRSILQREFTDDSGVNIDEELSNLIVVQTAYAAAARTVTAADEMFQELINSFRR